MKLTIVCVLTCFFTIPCLGWGVTGHRAIGMIAERNLNARAKKKIAILLGHEMLSLSSTWMDEIRSDSTYNYTSDWHWVTVETGQTYEQIEKNKNGDIIMTIERLIAALKTHQLDRKTEIEYLKMLVHLVGDIHQPLHVGCCDDQGGNKVKVRWFRNESNLHKVWDSDMIDDSKLSYTELVMALGSPERAQSIQWQSQGVREWAKESMGYRQQVYTIGDGNLGYKYTYKNMGTVKYRLLQAGIRLAGILNRVYG